MARHQQSQKNSAHPVESDRWTGLAAGVVVLAVALGCGYFIAFGGAGRMGSGLGSVTPAPSQSARIEPTTDALPGSRGLGALTLLRETPSVQAAELPDDAEPAADEDASAEDLLADEGQPEVGF